MDNWNYNDMMYLVVALIVFAICIIVLNVGVFEFEEADDE